MTRATLKRTTATGEVLDRPTVRIVLTTTGEYVAELNDRTLTLRPIRTRRGGPQEVTIPWGAIYVREMWERAEEIRRAKARARRARKWRRP